MVGNRRSILILDDDPLRHAAFAEQGRGHQIEHVWHVDEAKLRLSQTRFDLACLDNDLGTEEYLREGFEVAEYIAQMPRARRPRGVLIHSWNPPRAAQMEQILLPLYGPQGLARFEFGEFVLLPAEQCNGSRDPNRMIRLSSEGDGRRRALAALFEADPSRRQILMESVGIGEPEWEE